MYQFHEICGLVQEKDVSLERERERERMNNRRRRQEKWRELMIFFFKKRINNF